MNWLKRQITLYSIKKANEIDVLKNVFVQNLLDNGQAYAETFEYKALVLAINIKQFKLDIALILIGEKK